MLTAFDKRLLWRRGLSVLHDHWPNSLLSGEPFLEHGILTYFDGREVTFCGFPLRRQAPISGEAVEQLADIWVRERGAEAVSYVGPGRPALSSLKEYGLRCVGEYLGDEMSAELLIDVSERARIFHTRLYRRSQALGFDVCIRKGGLIRADQLRLIEQFYDRVRPLSNFLVGMAFAVLALLQNRNVYLVEARRHAQLCGFVILHKPFNDAAVGVFITHDQTVSGVSDFLYSQMVDLARELKAHAVNVGPSPTQGQYEFKRKWTAEPVIPPYYNALWARGKLARSSNCVWGLRLVRAR